MLYVCFTEERKQQQHPSTQKRISYCFISKEQRYWLVHRHTHTLSGNSKRADRDRLLLKMSFKASSKVFCRGREKKERERAKESGNVKLMLSPVIDRLVCTLTVLYCAVLWL